MDTLADHKSRPFVSLVSTANSRLQTVANNYSSVKKMLKEKEVELASPEGEAIWFYMSNHAMSIIAQKYSPYEPLGKAASLVDSYYSDMQIKALRMFFYLLIITTRESRHAHSGAKKDKLYAKYPAIGEWHAAKVQDTAASTAINSMLKSSPDVSMGEYVDFLYDAFVMCKYSGGFGGKAWANVAFPLREFVHGRISAEMMLDTAFTLAHNNGPIFNKGMLYDGYGSNLIKILDVQRAGMIPQLVAEEGIPEVRPAHQKYRTKVDALIGDFNGYVDWGQVMALGAVKNYSTELTYQKDKYGTPSGEKTLDAVALYQKKIIEAQKKKEAEEFELNNLEIMQGEYVPIVKPARQEAA